VVKIKDHQPPKRKAHSVPRSSRSTLLLRHPHSEIGNGTRSKMEDLNYGAQLIHTVVTVLFHLYSRTMTTCCHRRPSGHQQNHFLLPNEAHSLSVKMKWYFAIVETAILNDSRIVPYLCSAVSPVVQNQLCLLSNLSGTKYQGSLRQASQ